MIRFDIRLDKKLSALIAQMKAGLPEVLDQACKDTASFGKGKIIRSTAKDTGRTQGGWSVNQVKPMAYRIWNRFKHAMFLETGTGLFGPKHRKIIAEDVTKTGGPFFWITWKSRSKKKGGNIAELSFATETKGMPAQPAIKPNVEIIQKDLNVRTRKYIQRLFQRAKTAGIV